VSRALLDGAAATAHTLGQAIAAAVRSSGVGETLDEGLATPTGQAARRVATSDSGAAGRFLFAFRTVLLTYGPPPLPRIVNIWEGLEQAAKVLASSAGSATQSLVDALRTGLEAGEVILTVAEMLLVILGIAAINVRRIGVATIVRSTATEAAKDLLEKLEEVNVCAFRPRGSSWTTSAAIQTNWRW